MFSRAFGVGPKLFLVVFGIASVARDSNAEGPPAEISNWSAPAFWSPGSTGRSQPSRRTLSVEGDIGGALPFVPVTPCRIVDTRGANGTFGGPALVAGAPRNFPLTSGPCTGIPSAVGAYSLNITATNTLGDGFLLIYPQGGAQPVVSTLNYAAGQTVANAAIVPAGTGGGITVVAGVSGTQLIVDINGYYGASLNSGEQFLISASFGGGAIRGVNSSGDGVQGLTSVGGSSGVYGDNTGGGKGVFGASTTGSGVEGQSTSGAGVRGNSASGNGVYGFSAGPGVWGESTNNDGVHGHAVNNGFAGVAGIHASDGNGVYGSSSSGYGGTFESQTLIGLRASGAEQGIVTFATNTSPLNTKYNVGIFATNYANNFGPGVYGQSLHGPSVLGYSVGGFDPDPSDIVNGVHGVVGISVTPNGQNPNAGVLGENRANGPGVYATSAGAGFAGSAMIASNTTNGGSALYAYGSSSTSAAAVITNDSATTGGDIIQGWNQAAVKFKVTTTGEVYAHGAFHPSGVDYSDELPAESGLEPGDVVAISADGLLRRSSRRNQSDVAGVYSTKPGVIGSREQERRTTIPIALAGVVPVKASAENGAIRPGDLLVSSSTPGCAMRAPENPAPGTVIGKAMRGLEGANGRIEILVMLR